MGQRIPMAPSPLAKDRSGACNMLQHIAIFDRNRPMSRPKPPFSARRSLQSGHFHFDPDMRKLLSTLSALSLLASLGGCGVLAAPCRVTSAVLKMVPVVGHVAALPTDGCAAIID
jgi:hypothetical protein